MKRRDFLTSLLSAVPGCSLLKRLRPAPSDVVPRLPMRYAECVGRRYVDGDYVQVPTYNIGGSIQFPRLATINVKFKDGLNDDTYYALS